MKLTHARVYTFKSIEDSGDVPIDEKVTALVGQNESGKTAFLQALYKARPVEEGIAYDVTIDYPRKDLLDYEEVHKTAPAVVCKLTYELDEEEVGWINGDLSFPVVERLSFSVSHKYDGSRSVDLPISEAAYVTHVVETELPAEVRPSVKGAKTLRLLITTLEGQDLNEAGQKALDHLKTVFMKEGAWDALLSHYVWRNHLSDAVPRFLYFDEYKLLPGKTNLPGLLQRRQQKVLSDQDRAVLRLLHLAGVEIDALSSPGGYEQMKARLEATSSRLTRRVFEYWRQNTNLRVEVDIRDDPNDVAPFNSGKNLYLRVYNPRHDVSVAFDLRSKGFIWFFSFIAWFDSIKKDMQGGDRLTLLLDEPGLNLHALAQNDFLRYVEHLAERHQILYTTHSPFMVEGVRLHRVRTVEDQEGKGTLVSNDVTASSSDTLFPLQAALGYSIAQNLFIGQKNLLVEGIADLAYLQTFSALLDSEGRGGLREGIVVTPVGGLKKVPAFVSLFGANDLEIVVLHDHEGQADQQITHLVREKLLQERRVLNYAAFRDEGKTVKPTDVEDLLPPALFLQYLNKAYARELADRTIQVANLPVGDRIVDRVNRHLAASGIVLRASGGFNHYLVAREFAASPPPLSKVKGATLDRFDRLFRTVSGLFST